MKTCTIARLFAVMAVLALCGCEAIRTARTPHNRPQMHTRAATLPNLAATQAGAAELAQASAGIVFGPTLNR